MLTIISLFDWASCWQQAINQLWIKNYKYYASEIEKNAIFITQKNYPNTIQLGSVTDIYLKSKDTFVINKKNSLLIWWSPCTNLSFAWKRKWLITKENIKITTLEQYLDLKEKWFEFEWQSYLFWEFIRIREELKPRYFLLENVVMTKEWESIFNEAVWFDSVKINSSLMVAQNRKRLYWIWELQEDWTYKKIHIEQPEDKGVLLKDILQKTDIDEKYYLNEKYIERIKNRKATQKPLERILNENSKSHCLTARGAGEDHSWMILYNERIQEFLNFNQDNVFLWIEDKSPTLTAWDWKLRPKILVPQADKKWYDWYRIRKLTPLECERLQGWADNYTSWVSDSARYKMIWNWWTVPVITYLLNHLDLWQN